MNGGPHEFNLLKIFLLLNFYAGHDGVKITAHAIDPTIYPYFARILYREI